MSKPKTNRKNGVRIRTHVYTGYEGVGFMSWEAERLIIICHGCGGTGCGLCVNGVGFIGAEVGDPRETVCPFTPARALLKK